MKKIKKSFNTLTVLGAYTGFLLEDNFSNIHEIFDFFYPEITTLGICALTDNLKKQLLICVPELQKYPTQNINCSFVSKQAIKEFGLMIELFKE